MGCELYIVVLYEKNTGEFYSYATSSCFCEIENAEDYGRTLCEGKENLIYKIDTIYLHDRYVD